MSEVTVTLSKDEALVLFELLHRWEDANTIDPVLLPGEQTALWNLSCALERVLSEPFAHNYNTLIAGARDRLHEQGGG
ncbi:MAG TPA: hypothetical protein VFR11_14880 [Micromonosporaceae bacterium]|jgi:hypothetical protein|nr:hypothetical protein [Micromonosporaceae bacterium]